MPVCVGNRRFIRVFDRIRCLHDALIIGNIQDALVPIGIQHAARQNIIAIPGHKCSREFVVVARLADFFSSYYPPDRLHE